MGRKLKFIISEKKKEEIYLDPLGSNLVKEYNIPNDQIENDVEYQEIPWI
ncbi:MAG: hypothetical protein ACFFCY_14955 [Promethearchaeota archaeon]